MVMMRAMTNGVEQHTGHQIERNKIFIRLLVLSGPPKPLSPLKQQFPVAQSLTLVRCPFRRTGDSYQTRTPICDSHSYASLHYHRPLKRHDLGLNNNLALPICLHSSSLQFTIFSPFTSMSKFKSKSQVLETYCSRKFPLMGQKKIGCPKQ